MPRLNVASLIVGGLAIAAGAALVFLPAGLVVLGVELAAVGLFVDDGTGDGS